MRTGPSARETKVAFALLTVLSSAVLAIRPASAQWVDGGLPVCVTPTGKYGVLAAPDGIAGGGSLPSGVYFLRLTMGGHTVTRRAVLLTRVARSMLIT